MLQKSLTHYSRPPVLNYLLKLRAFGWWVEAGVWTCNSHVSGCPDYQSAFPFLKGNNLRRMGWEASPKGPWAAVLEQTQVSREKLGQVFAPEGLASVVTTLAPLCVPLPAQALSCTIGRSRLWAAQYWRGRRNIDALRMWLLRLGSWWVRSFEISLMSACAQGSKCQVDT